MRCARPPLGTHGVSASSLALAAVLTAVLAGCGQGGSESTLTISPTPAGPEGAPPPQAPSPGSSIAPSPSSGGASGTTRGPGTPTAPKVVETVAEGLSVPWGLDFFANGDALVTERDTTRVLRITGRQRTVQEVGTLPGVTPGGEGGALGLAISPDFERDRSVYFYLTTAEDNRVVRTDLEGGVLGVPEVILENIPVGFTHDGGRLAFGPDGYLYVSTGDTADPTLAQDPTSLAGKILRITTDGEAAPGNPGGSVVWSQGHLDVQGLAFDERDNLWATDVGNGTFDELNLIEAGEDYGWPAYEGQGGQDALADGFVDPQQVWGTDVASPAGLATAGDYLWMGALQGERLWRLELRGDRALDPQPFFIGDYGRLRTVATAPDGSVWFTTSNRDGSGEPTEVDDRILRLAP